MKLNSLTQSLCLTALVMWSMTHVGCGKPAAPPASGSAADPGAMSDAVDPAAVEALSAEDQALVEAQVYCPVGGKLGGMGTPVKVMVEDKPVFICCEHCREPLLANPEKYLAELAEKLKKDAEATEAQPESSEASESSEES